MLCEQPALLAAGPAKNLRGITNSGGDVVAGRQTSTSEGEGRRPPGSKNLRCPPGLMVKAVHIRARALARSDSWQPIPADDVLSGESRRRKCRQTTAATNSLGDNHNPRPLGRRIGCECLCWILLDQRRGVGKLLLPHIPSCQQAAATALTDSRCWGPPALH